jgi:hypothetical protein
MRAGAPAQPITVIARLDRATQYRRALAVNR